MKKYFAALFAIVVSSVIFINCDNVVVNAYEAESEVIKELDERKNISIQYGEGFMFKCLDIGEYSVAADADYRRIDKVYNVRLDDLNYKACFGFKSEEDLKNMYEYTQIIDGFTDGTSLEAYLDDLLCSKVIKYYVRYADVPEDREFKPGTSIEECVR